jgi:hypothetical protein
MLLEKRTAMLQDWGGVVGVEGEEEGDYLLALPVGEK